MKLVHLWVIVALWELLLIVGMIIEGMSESRETIDNIALCAMFLAYSLVPMVLAISIERVVKYNREYKNQNAGQSHK